MCDPYEVSISNILRMARYTGAQYINFEVQTYRFGSTSITRDVTYGYLDGTLRGDDCDLLLIYERLYELSIQKLIREMLAKQLENL
jgi:hypothetical protein